MPKNTNIILGEHFDDFIARQIAEGRYASASEVVRAGLRMLEDNEHKIAVLRYLLIINVLPKIPGLVQLQDKIVARYALTIYPYSLGYIERISWFTWWKCHQFFV
jgi:putative addiction module CopG family antidote